MGLVKREIRLTGSQGLLAVMAISEYQKMFNEAETIRVNRLKVIAAEYPEFRENIDFEQRTDGVYIIGLVEEPEGQAPLKIEE